MERTFEIPRDSLHFQLLFYELDKFDGMRLKIEGALILCVRVRHIMLVNLTIMLFSVALKIVPLCRKLCSFQTIMLALVMYAEISPLNSRHHPNKSQKLKTQYFKTTRDI